MNQVRQQQQQQRQYGGKGPSMYEKGHGKDGSNGYNSYQKSNGKGSFGKSFGQDFPYYGGGKGGLKGGSWNGIWGHNESTFSVMGLGQQLMNLGGCCGDWYAGDGRQYYDPYGPATLNLQCVSKTCGKGPELDLEDKPVVSGPRSRVSLMMTAKSNAKCRFAGRQSRGARSQGTSMDPTPAERIQLSKFISGVGRGGRGTRCLPKTGGGQGGECTAKDSDAKNAAEL